MGVCFGDSSTPASSSSLTYQHQAPAEFRASSHLRFRLNMGSIHTLASLSSALSRAHVDVEKGLVVTLTTEKVAVCNTNSGAWSRKRKASNVSGVYRSFVDISAEEVDVLKGLTTCGQGSVEEYVSAHPEVVETFVRIANTAREGVRLIRAPLQPGPIARELVPPSVEGLFFKGGPSDNDKRCALRYPHTLQSDSESECDTYKVFVAVSDKTRAPMVFYDEVYDEGCVQHGQDENGTDDDTPSSSTQRPSSLSEDLSRLYGDDNIVAKCSSRGIHPALLFPPIDLFTRMRPVARDDCKRGEVFVFRNDVLRAFWNRVEHLEFTFRCSSPTPPTTQVGALPTCVFPWTAAAMLHESCPALMVKVPTMWLSDYTVPLPGYNTLLSQSRGK